MHRRIAAFTLPELLVTISVLVVLSVLFARLLGSASTIATTGQKRLDTDTEARQIFSRMAADFAQMVRRKDVDCYLKGTGPDSLNDQIAFFAHVPGYYPTSGPQSPLSLVAYRINGDSKSAAYMKLERMGKGLLWNGVSAAENPLIFGPAPTLATNWPTATTNDSADPDYETFGQHVFRFEYFYQLVDGTVADAPNASGVAGISAISVCIGVIDARSRVVLSDDKTQDLASRMVNYDTSLGRGGLIAAWQAKLDGITDMPRSAVSAIRLYQRDFYLR